MTTITSNKNRMEQWRISTPEAAGLHHVIKPGAQDCLVANMFRLNLPAGKKHAIASGPLELNAVVVAGSCSVKGSGLDHALARYDSFYVTGGSEVEITAETDASLYIGGAACEGVGENFARHFDPDLPLGDVRQVHGAGVGRRDVFFTLNPEVKASRLICGLTWGGDGQWTSWPPHQHEKDLEEVYCYFDMDAPKFGFHLSYLSAGRTDEVVAHFVRSGDMVLAPAGYHPTVASPGTRNSYFWVLAAHSAASRRYDLAVLDPFYAGT